MKKMIIILAMIVMATGLWGQEQNQQERKMTEAEWTSYIQLMRLNLKAEKANIIVQSIQFTDEESKNFWPVYKKYEEKLDKVSDQRVAFIRSFAENYDTMTDAKADELMNAAFQYQKERLALTEELYKNVKKVLGPVKAVKLIQLEHQINLLIDLKINSELPLIKAANLKDKNDKK